MRLYREDFYERRHPAVCRPPPAPVRVRCPPVETSSYGGYTVRIEASGFSVGEHTYYREAVEDLYLTMKPCRYQLDLRATQEDAAELRAYLAKHLRPGETVELWNLWVGNDPARPRRFSGALGDVELDTLKQLEENFQTCLTIRI